MEKNTKAMIALLGIMLTTLLIVVSILMLLEKHHHHENSLLTNLPAAAPHNWPQWRAKLIRTDDLISSPTKTKNFSQRLHYQMLRDKERAADIAKMLLLADKYGSVTPDNLQRMGDYDVMVGVGNPPQILRLTIDTGSDLTWIQCKDCINCNFQVDALFDPSASSSFQNVTCGSKPCKSLGNVCVGDICAYKVSYLDKSITKGTVALEQIRFGGGVSQVALGCGRETTENLHGILGLGNRGMSFVNQLDGSLNEGFSYCLNSDINLPPDWLEFGTRWFSENAVWFPLQRNPLIPTHYYISFLGIGVGDVRLPIPEDIFKLSKSGKGGVILDSGTTITMFPREIYEVLRDEFRAQATNMTRVPPVIDWLETCYNFTSQVTTAYPVISFYFDDAIYRVGGRGTFLEVDDFGTHCLAFASLDSDHRFSIIGNVQQAGIQVSYYLSKGLVGFGPTSC